MKLKPTIPSVECTGIICDGIFTVKKHKIKAHVIYYVAPITGNPSEKDVYFMVYDSKNAAYFVTDGKEIWQCEERPAYPEKLECTYNLDDAETISIILEVIEGGSIEIGLHHAILEIAKNYANE